MPSEYDEIMNEFAFDIESATEEGPIAISDEDLKLVELMCDEVGAVGGGHVLLVLILKLVAEIRRLNEERSPEKVPAVTVKAPSDNYSP
jgi:hypothetical protein